MEGLVKIEAVAPADDDAYAIYQYLIGSEGGRGVMMEQVQSVRSPPACMQPWGLWWLQARRAGAHRGAPQSVLVEGVVDLLPRLRPHGHHPHPSAVRAASGVSMTRRHQRTGRHRPVLLHPPRHFLWLPGDLFAADSRRNDRAQPALLSAVAGAPRGAAAGQVRGRFDQRPASVRERDRSPISR